MLLVDVPQRMSKIEKARKMLVAPVIVGKALVAIILADHGRDDPLYTSEETLALKGIAHIAALVIERDRAERAYERARHDYRRSMSSCCKRSRSRAILSRL